MEIGTRLAFAVEEAKHPKLLYIESLKVFTLNRSEIMSLI